jgi:hypothetical protein
MKPHHPAATSGMARGAFLAAVLALHGLSVNAARHALSLGDIGFARGLLIQGQGGEATFYFPVPADTRITAANVNVRYSASPLLGRHSNLRVAVNGVPRQAVPLGGGQGGQPSANTDGSISVALSPEDLRKSFVEIAVKVTFLVSDDYCLDERVNAGFVSVLPGTAVTYTTDGAPSAIRGFVDTLPRVVTLAAEATAGASI